jgi:glycosyltransferase involved in cell wall biosynthesis
VTVLRPRQRHEQHAGDDFLVRSLAFPFDATLRMGLPEGRRLTRRWRGERPDLVHVATQGPLGASALFVARRLGLPVATSFHTNFDQFAAHYGIKFLVPAIVRYLRAFHNRVAVTLVPSESARARLAALGFQRLRIVGRGVDGARFHPNQRRLELRRALGIRDDELALLSVGRLAPEKGIALAIEAARAISATRPARLIVVGDGPLRRALSAANPDARFLGHLDGDDLARHYASADLFLFPSRTETFGNVVLEAMASGLPVIAFADAAAAECIRNGVDGVTVPLESPAAFVDAAVRVAADDDLRSALGRDAHSKSAAFTWDAVGADLARELTTVVTSSA